MNDRKKVGILGGTFNPIHMGHLLLAESAYEAFELDKVLFIPSGCSYMKEQSEILDGRRRLDMTALSIEDNPHFALSAIELERAGNTYTYETIAKLKQENPDTDYYFIVGADSLFQMEDWRCPEKIFGEAVVLAAVRDDYDRQALDSQARHLAHEYGADVRLLSAGTIFLSSSEIRKRIREGKSVRYMVAEQTREYILKHSLYQRTHFQEPKSSQAGTNVCQKRGRHE